jgi:hypothetical protein
MPLVRTRYYHSSGRRQPSHIFLLDDQPGGVAMVRANYHDLIAGVVEIEFFWWKGKWKRNIVFWRNRRGNGIPISD